MAQVWRTKQHHIYLKHLLRKNSHIETIYYLNPLKKSRHLKIVPSYGTSYMKEYIATLLYIKIV